MKLNKFLKDILTMSSSPIVTQALSILLLPFILRFYGPEQYGIFALYAAIISPAIAFSGFAYPTALMVSKDFDERNSLVILSCLTTVLAIFFILPIIIALNFFFPDFFMFLAFEYVLALIIYNLLIHNLFLIFRYLNLKDGNFRLLALSGIAKFIFTNTFLIITIIYYSPSAINLIIAELLGSLANLIVLIKFNYIKLFSIKKVTIKLLKKCAYKHQKFFKFNLPNEFVGRVNEQLPIFILSYFFGTQVVGFYALANRVINIPFTFIGNSIGEVFFNRGSYLNRDDLKILTEKIFKSLASISWIPVIILFFFAEDIFLIFFGESWGPSGQLVQILSLYLFIRFIFLPSTYLVNLTNQQNKLFRLSIYISVFISAGITIGGFLESYIISIILSSTVMGSLFLLFGINIFKQSDISSKYILKILFQNFMISVPFITTILVFKFSLISPFLLSLLSLLSIGFYFFMLLRMHNNFFYIISK